MGEISNTPYLYMILGIGMELRISLHCKLVPVQCRKYEYRLFQTSDVSGPLTHHAGFKRRG